MGGKPIHVLLVDSGRGSCADFESQLAEADVARFRLEPITRTEMTLERLDHNHVDVMLLHVSVADALEILPEIQRHAPSVPVVVLSDEENETAAVEAVRSGAQDYLVRSKTDGRTLAHGLRYAIERKRAEEALQKSEAFYHSLVESLPQNIFRKDLLGRFTFGNRRFCGGIGKPLNEIVGRTDADFFPAELAEKYRTDDLGVIETGKTFETIEQYVTAEGETLHVQVIKTPVHDATGKLIGTQGIFWDITQRVRSEEQLRGAYSELAAKEQTLLQTMTMLKSSHEDLIQAQLQLIQAEKLESVGSLAAGVAHEVKNPLAILLMGLTYLAEGGTRDPAADHEVMRAMREAIHRANLIVRGLVDFSANHQLDAVPQDLNAMIGRSLLLVKHEMTVNHIAGVTNLDASLPKVLLDANKVQQVFINLFMNAIQAMQPGGTLTVRTYCREAGDRTRDEATHSCQDAEAGGIMVVAEVDDTGTGIPPDKLSKVFDPFFTTKAAGRGTGLGLTVVQKIVELHDGTVSIRNRYRDDNSTCTGTRTSRLPSKQFGAVQMTTTTTVPAQKRILIVDDEPDMTFLVRLNLQKTGRFEVQEENRASQAIDVARDFKPDLILLDVMMPELDGGDVLALLKDDPDLRNIPVVFLTATVLKEEVNSNQGRIGGYPFISKPFEVDTLVARIDTLLSESANPSSTAD